MALIGTLRNKMGALVVVFIFVSIAAFTLSDILGNNSFLLGDDNVGEIAGTSISMEEYRAAIQEREMNFRLYYNRPPAEADMPLIHDQAWELLVAEHAIQKQYEKLGVTVPSEEVEDMIWGKNVDESLKSTPIFLDESGQFDKNKVVQYLQYISQLPQGNMDRFRWESYQQNLAPARIRVKYENLLIKTAYATAAEAEREYHLQNDVAEVKYLFVPYYAINDSSASVTDADLLNYYNKNKEKYKTEHTADFSYVTFPVVASPADSTDIRVELQRLAQEFKNATNDSIFAISNSNSPDAYARYTPNTLPPYISPDSLVEGKVMGPFVDNGSYKVVKVSKVGTDTIFSARARHILITWADESDLAKREAREKAEGILKELQGGADFAVKARIESEDQQSATRGGDLGWFSSGDMVKPFQDAVFDATRPGLVNRLVESQYGYHIIDVTNVKDNTAYWIGSLEIEISPSDVTINDALRKAELFQSGVSSASEFVDKAAAEGLSVLDAKDITTSDRRIGVLGNAREIVQWIFRDASVGEVSAVFDLKDQFVVGVVTNEIEKGYKPFESVKEDITPAVRNEVKGKIITERLSKLEGTLDEMASAFGSDATVQSNSNLKLTTNSLPAVGADVKAVGLAFSLDNGERSAPFAGENGVVIFEMQNKTLAPAVGDYSLYKNQLQQRASSRITYSIAEAIKESSDIEDNRYKVN